MRAKCSHSARGRWIRSAVRSSADPKIEPSSGPNRIADGTKHMIESKSRRVPLARKSAGNTACHEPSMSSKLRHVSRTGSAGLAHELGAAVTQTAQDTRVRLLSRRDLISMHAHCRRGFKSRGTHCRSRCSVALLGSVCGTIPLPAPPGGGRCRGSRRAPHGREGAAMTDLEHPVGGAQTAE